MLGYDHVQQRAWELRRTVLHAQRKQWAYPMPIWAISGGTYLANPRFQSSVYEFQIVAAELGKAKQLPGLAIFIWAKPCLTERSLCLESCDLCFSSAEWHKSCRGVRDDNQIFLATNSGVLGGASFEKCQPQTSRNWQCFPHIATIIKTISISAMKYFCNVFCAKEP